MKFDSGRFDNAEFTPREATVNVESLREFFHVEEDDTGPCTWKVRGLTANELQKAFDAAKTTGDVSKIVEGITNSGQVAKKIRDIMGLGDATPPEIAKRLEMLVAGSVEPQITLQTAAKLAENFPIEFLELTRKITELTGLGSSLVKPEAASLETAA